MSEIEALKIAIGLTDTGELIMMGLVGTLFTPTGINLSKLARAELARRLVRKLEQPANGKSA